MVKRLLLALDYPNAEKVNVNDENHLRRVIVWLEETKIKKYNNLQQLKNVSHPEWPNYLESYRKTVGCPAFSTRSEQVEWLLGYVLQREYSEKKNVYNQHAVEHIKSENVPNVVAENPLDKLDFRCKEFCEGINAVAKMLKISPHPDSLITLKAVTKLISERLNQNALDNPNEHIIKGTPFPFQDLDLGFDLNDPILNQAAKVLRMLYIHNLRDLQTKANELIVAAQSVTANPKTDTRLGKVGNKN